MASKSSKGRPAPSSGTKPESTVSDHPLNLRAVPDLLGSDISEKSDWQGPAEALLSLQGKPASDVWTCEEWTKLCRHLHNDNGPTQFVMGFQKEGVKHYVRSKNLLFAKAISWSWSTIRGHSKSGLTFVPYCTNSSRASRWGAMDFDAHDGDLERARRLSFAAFRRLLDANLFMILEFSGAGWHVWVISKDFHPVNDWVRLLKKVAVFIGAPIKPGVCEIFPPDTLSNGLGKGLRAPGSWNPSTDTLSEIYWENTDDLLRGLSLDGCAADPKQLTDTERNLSFSSSFSCSASGHGSPVLYWEWERNWCERFSITVTSTRNDQLANLVGEMFHQVGHGMAARIVETQFNSKTVATNSNLKEHLESFEGCWRGLHEKWLACLSNGERHHFQALTTANERDAFRILVSFQKKAQADGLPDFPIAVGNLGERLGITKQGASELRRKFAKLGIVKMTQPYQPNKRAARYKWLLAGDTVAADRLGQTIPSDAALV